MNALGFLLEGRQRNIVYLIIAFASVFLIDSCQGVPPNYCLAPLNVSDCNGPPTRVFFYYKPRSQCEIGLWRGCPTYNKFPDEVVCSHICIGKLIEPYRGENDITGPILTETTTEAVIDEWINELKAISQNEADEINDLLDDILPEKPNKVKLKFSLPPVTKESIEETSTTETTEEPSTEETTLETTTTEATTIEVTTTEASTTEATTTEATTTEATTTEATTTEAATETTTELVTVLTTEPESDPDEVITT